jgi:hypothetical protein
VRGRTNGVLPTKVVYVVVDGMSTAAFEQVTACGRAPAFSFLKDRAHYVRDAVAIFPTITPAATSSLITGATPAEHRVPGMCWYDRDVPRFVNYGQSPRAAVVEGMSQIVEDVLVNLNEHHLSRNVATLHESLDELGFVSASINYMIFRGPYEHELKPNMLEKLLFRKQLPKRLRGPKEHYFADVCSGDSEACSGVLNTRGLDKRIKATDAYAACVTRELLERDAADMILFYMHENDHHSHETGPHGQIDSLAEADENLQHVFDGFDSWEQAIEEVGWVVTADHSQSPVMDDDDHVFALEDVCEEFEKVDPSRGEEPMDGRDMAIAGNGRLGFVYLSPDRKSLLHSSVVACLEEADGIDQVMYQDGDDYVVHSDRGRVHFRDANEDDGVVDERGHWWSYEGDLGAVGGVVEESEIRTSEYPLAFWRIKNALDLDRTGDIVITTKLGYEVKDLAGGDHRGGGDHGSLHAQDSLIPFLSTLDPPPRHPVTSDLAPHILDHFKRLQS